MKTDEEPKVAIVLLNYNGHDDTIRCIDSLKKLDYSNYDIIVVDNGSTDGSEKYLRTIEGTHLQQTGRNLGYAGGNNIGIKYALKLSPNYILVLNNDTVVERSLLVDLVHSAGELPALGVCGCKILDGKGNIWFGGGRLIESIGTTKTFFDERLNEVTEVSFVTGCMLFIKREIFEEVGFFDDRYFMYFEDAQFCYRVRKHGFKCYYIPSIKITHMIEDGRNTELSAYFTLRNRQIFIKEDLNNSLIPRLYFYSMNYFKIVYYWIIRDKLYKLVLKAMRDFKSGKTGNSLNENIH